MINTEISTKNIVFSPCVNCVKSDVCKYKSEIDELVLRINRECLSQTDILDIHFTCKKQKIKNGNTYRIFDGFGTVICNKGDM